MIAGKKKMFAVLALVLFGGISALVYAVTITNLGEVISVYTLSDTRTATLDTSVILLAVPPLGAQVDTNTLTTASSYLPRGLGDELIGLVSNVIYKAAGTTTNDWVLISP